MQNQDDSSTNSVKLPGTYESTQDVRLPPGPLQRIDPGTADHQRYQFVRHHARGGLGQVSVAIDQKFGRTVAFKEISDRSPISSTSKEYFLREAEVTGTLEHPGIVPIYDVGYRDDGSPFYAMRFIEGQSLKNAIASFHTEHSKSNRSEWHQELRALVSRLIEVCNAIEYAHSRGVLHRDIKPGNVMLGPFGETLVVDWGLARKLDEEKQDGFSAEQTVVGTAGYMSPEQSVSADRVDVRSDVYSLGATLYTMLTGQVSVQIKTLAELQMFLAGSLFPSPRKIEKRSPGPLDAVCQKAMAVSPEDRYQSVAEFSCALRRWLSNQSIKAYREPIHERSVRWVSRHRTISAGVMALLCAAVIGLGISARNANLQKAKSEASLTQLMKTTERFFDDTEDYLKGVPALTSLRTELMKESHQLHEELLAENPSHPQVTARTSRVCFTLAELYYEAQRTVEARELYERGLQLCDSLEGFQGGLFGSQSLTAKLWYFNAHCQYCGFLVEADTPERSEPYIQRMLDELKGEQGLLASEKRLFTAGLQLQMARVFDRQGKPDSAIEFLQLAKAEFLVNENSSVAQVSNCLAMLADAMQQKGELNKAEVVWTDAIAYAEKSLDKTEQAKGRTRDECESWLAGCIKNRAQLWCSLGRVNDSIPEFQKALEIYSKVSRRFPGIADYALSVVSSRSGLAVTYCRSGKLEESLPEYEQAIADIRQLVDRYPQEPGYQRVLGTTLRNFATSKYQLGQFEEALELSKQVVASNRRMAERFSEPGYHLDLANSEIFYAASLTRTNANLDTTLAVYRSAIGTLERLSEQLPEPTVFRSKLALAYMNQADLMAKHGLRESPDYFQKAEALYLELVKDSPENLELPMKLAMIRDNRGRIALQQQKWVSAEEHLVPAIDYFDKAWAQGHRQQGVSRKRIKVRRLLAEALVGQKKYSQAFGMINRAIGAAEEIHEHEPDQYQDEVAELLVLRCATQLAGFEKAGDDLTGINKTCEELEKHRQKLEESESHYFLLRRRLLRAQLLSKRQEFDESDALVLSVTDDIQRYEQLQDSPIQDYDLTELKVEALQAELDNKVEQKIAGTQAVVGELEKCIELYASEESVPIDAVSTQDARLNLIVALLKQGHSNAATQQLNKFSDFVTEFQLQQLCELFLSPTDERVPKVQTVSDSQTQYSPEVVFAFRRILAANPESAAQLKIDSRFAGVLVD